MSPLHTNLLELLILFLPLANHRDMPFSADDKNDTSVIVVNYFKVVVRDILRGFGLLV